MHSLDPCDSSNENGADENDTAQRRKMWMPNALALLKTTCPPCTRTLKFAE